MSCAVPTIPQAFPGSGFAKRETDGDSLRKWNELMCADSLDRFFRYDDFGSTDFR